MKMLNLNYNIDDLVKIIDLVQKYNNKYYNNCPEDCTRFYLCDDIQLRHSIYDTTTYSSTQIMHYNIESRKWQNVISYVRSSDSSAGGTIRKFTSLGSIGYILSIHPSTHWTKDIILNYVDDDSYNYSISDLYKDDEYESILFQSSVSDITKYNKLIQTRIIEKVQPVLLYGELTFYNNIYSFSQEQIQSIIDKLNSILGN